MGRGGGRGLRGSWEGEGESIYGGVFFILFESLWLIENGILDY